LTWPIGMVEWVCQSTARRLKMAKEIVFIYTMCDDDERDIDDIVNSIERDLSSSDGPGQCMYFAGVRELQD